MKIEFELTADDRSAFELFHVLNGQRLFPRARGNVRRAILTIAVLLLGGIFFVLVGLFIPSKRGPTGIILLGILFIMVGLWQTRNFWLSRKAIARPVPSAGEKCPIQSPGHMAVEVEPEGLRVAYASGEMRAPWASFLCAVQGKDAIYLYTTLEQAHIFPRRAFADDAQANEFYETALRHVEASKQQSSTPSK